MACKFNRLANTWGLNFFWKFSNYENAITFLDFEKKIPYFLSNLEKIPTSQQSYCSSHPKFGMQVCLISRHLTPLTVLRIFEFWAFYDTFGLWKNPVIPQNCQKFHIYRKFTVWFLPNFAYKFVHFVGTLYRKLFREFQLCLNFWT